MNKDICKAKTVYDGKWAYGYYVVAPWEYSHELAHLIIDQDTSYRGSGEFFWMDVRSVDPSTVCRCTGLEDRHGTPIFERDIVEFTCGSHKDRYLIWWCNEMCMLTAVPLDGIEFNGWDYWSGKYPQFDYDAFCFMMQDPYGDFSDIKVIGNIVDNTELMEV